MPNAKMPAIVHLCIFVALLSSGAAHSITLLGITPNTGSGDGGTHVVITATGLNVSLTTNVTFDPFVADDVVVQDGSPQTISCTTPAHSAGAVNIFVSQGSQLGVMYNGFTYTAPSPIPTSISPTGGPPQGGTQVSIQGAHLTTVGVTRVTFGGVDATNVVVHNGGYGSMYISCNTPAHAVGTVDVAIINPDGAAGSITIPFHYESVTAPQLTSVSPVIGGSSGGAAVKLFGSGFMQYGLTQITFGGVAAYDIMYVDADPPYLMCTTAAHAVGAVDVVVTNPSGGGTSTLPHSFTFVSTPDPHPTSVAPSSGITYGGTAVSVACTGTVSTGVTHVYFADVEATDVQVSGTLIHCTTPEYLAAGYVNVTVVNPNGQTGMARNAYVYIPVFPPIPDPPMPNKGSIEGGTTVSILGSNFQTTGTTRVLFDGVDATNVQVKTFEMEPYISCVIPPHAAGPVDVTVYNPDGGRATLTNAFTYVAPIKATFEAEPTNGPAPLTVEFSDLSTSGAPILDWLWQFGDGTISHEPNPSHAYASRGAYSVSLTVTSDIGTSTLIKTWYIDVGHSLPATMLLGLAMLGASLAVGGAFIQRRKK